MEPGCPLDCSSSEETRQVFDFTGTVLDTVAEMQAMGFIFSDNDTPFPDTIYAAVDGTWTHDAGVGWKAVCAVDAKGPVLMLPLVRPRNWETAITFNFAVGAVGDKGRLVLGSATANGDFIALGFSEDQNAGATELTCHLYTNNGDDSITTRHSGDALAGAGDRELKLRGQNGCVSVYDEQSDTWVDYTGRQAAGVDYTPAYIFIQVQKITGATLADFTIKDLTMIYP
jgi:hypothetical protein